MRCGCTGGPGARSARCCGWGCAAPGVPAEWVNIWDDQAAAARVRAITGGDETVPTVVVGGRAMVNPSAWQVVAAVRAGRLGPLPVRAGWLARTAGFVTRRQRRLAVD